MTQIIVNIEEEVNCTIVVQAQNAMRNSKEDEIKKKKKESKTQDQLDKELMIDAAKEILLLASNDYENKVVYCSKLCKDKKGQKRSMLSKKDRKILQEIVDNY